MSGIMTRWVVQQEHSVTADDLGAEGTVRDDTVARWVSAAQEEYLDRCAGLRRLRAGSSLVVRARPGRQPSGESLGRPTSVVVTASVTEFRPDSFTISVRLRPGGGDRETPVNATTVISLADPATGVVQELGKEIRDELIALEHSARYFN